MADSKITQLQALASPAAEDLLVVVDDPSGAPATRKATIADVLKLAWPVGSIFLSAVAASPATLLGFGTWVAVAVGKFLVGYDAGDPAFDTEEETGGSKTHTLAVANLPAHNHQILRERSATTGGATTQIARTADSSSTVDTNVFTENTGSGQAVTHLPPYYTARAWKRTA